MEERWEREEREEGREGKGRGGKGKERTVWKRGGVTRLTEIALRKVTGPEGNRKVTGPEGNRKVTGPEIPKTNGPRDCAVRLGDRDLSAAMRNFPDLRAVAAGKRAVSNAILHAGCTARRRACWKSRRRPNRVARRPSRNSHLRSIAPQRRATAPGPKGKPCAWV